MKERLKFTQNNPEYIDNKSDWPWTQDSEPLPDRMPDGSPWPKISIVTPSYNQAQYLEETIRSVLLQGYPNLEYIIIDGGSTDGSVEIIKRYEPWLTYWVTEPDRGQSHAINKGFERSTGEIMAWINSDDYYAPKAFELMATTFSKHPDALWAAGQTDFVEQNGEFRKGWGRPVEEIERWFVGPVVMQQGVFWRRELWSENKHIDESLLYSFDYDLWFQFTLKQKFPIWINKITAYFRIHDESKTFLFQNRFHDEFDIIRERYSYLTPLLRQKIRVKILQNEHKSNKFLANNKQKHGITNLTFIVKGLLLSPWYLFKRSFYSRVKQLIFG